jgi:hypothetical protein
MKLICSITYHAINISPHEIIGYIQERVYLRSDTPLSFQAFVHMSVCKTRQWNKKAHDPVSYFTLQKRVISSYRAQKLVVSTTWYLKLKLICRIWGSHSGEYEDGCLLGCSAV